MLSTKVPARSPLICSILLSVVLIPKTSLSKYATSLTIRLYSFADF